MSELKLCPFCGAEAQLTHEYFMPNSKPSWMSWDEAEVRYVKIKCTVCSAQISKGNETKAKAAWNRRVEGKSERREVKQNE